MEFGHSALMRRDRLERIAMAERDRRAGRIDVAVASVGEATEWPARVVLALARLSDGEANETRQILEEGLDVWADEVGLDSLDSSPAVEAMLKEAKFVAVDVHGARGSMAGDREPESDLDRPIDNNELERAFAQAEAQTDEMLDVNHVAERVLMSESAGFASLSGDELVPTHDHDDPGDDSLADIFGMDAAEVPPPSPVPGSTFSSSSPSLSDALSGDAGFGASEPGDAQAESRPSRDRVLATLVRWLENLEAGSARRA